MRILILDDDDIRHEAFTRRLHIKHDCVHVHTAQGAMEALHANPAFDIVFLDHDLNDHQYTSTETLRSAETASSMKVNLTGYRVAAFISKELAAEKRPATVVVHSWNTPGGDSMMMVLKEGGIRALRWFFDSTFKGVNIF